MYVVLEGMGLYQIHLFNGKEVNSEDADAVYVVSLVLRIEIISGNIRFQFMANNFGRKLFQVHLE